MNISSSKRKIENSDNLDNYASYYLKSPSGALTYHEVNETGHWNKSLTNIKGELFNVGGGSGFVTENEYQLDFGSHVLTPQNDFAAWVLMWGGGGGGQETSGGNWGGGGGFTRGLVKFEAGVAYTLIVGEGARHANVSTHGGGGKGHSGGGDGGGLTGLFYNSDYIGRAAWGHSQTQPVKRENALLIAGGGGGKGHHANANVGGGGGGGGWSGKNGHNANGGTQHGGGNAGYNNGGNNGGGHGFHGGHAYQASSWQGGGGGGWYGGGGGGHTSTHHNGGGGGSGHHAHPAEFGVQPNNKLSKYITRAHTVASPSAHHAAHGRPANFRNPYCYSAGRDGASVGRGAHANNQSQGSRHGKIVMNFVPGYLHQVFDNKNHPQSSALSSFNQGTWRNDRN